MWKKEKCFFFFKQATDLFHKLFSKYIFRRDMEISDCRMQLKIMCLRRNNNHFLIIGKKQSNLFKQI